jgi:hypothetical protein
MPRASYQVIAKSKFLLRFFKTQPFKLFLLGTFFLMSCIPTFANQLQNISVSPSVVVGNSIETVTFSLVVDTSVPGFVVYGEEPSNPINLCVGPGGGAAGGNITVQVQCGAVLQATTFTFFASQVNPDGSIIETKTATVTVIPNKLTLSVSPNVVDVPSTGFTTAILTATLDQPLPANFNEQFEVVASPMVGRLSFATIPIGVGNPQSGQTTLLIVGPINQETVVTLTSVPVFAPSTSTTLTLRPANATPLQLEALLVSPGNDDEFIVINGPNAGEAHFPLGSTFQLNLWKLQPDGSRIAVPASFTLAPTATFSNTLGPDPMFPNNVAFAFLPQTSTSGMMFQATHEGNQNLTIHPADASLDVVTLKLVVDPPQSLGSTHNNFDAGIISVADSTGVPPQMIKGQVAAEGRFNPFTFRYEPLNLTVGDLGVSRGGNLRAQNPFANFRLPTIGDFLNPGGCNPFPDVNLGIPDSGCPGLAIGGSFSQHEMDVITGPNQDFHLRTWQRDAQTGQLILNNHQRVSRQLASGDRYVSALDVFQASDRIFHFTSFAPAPRANQLTFTGEFPLAGSYGLLQMMYVTAINESRWQGSNPACDGATDRLDPTGLYDTTCNLQNGGGSLGLGTQKVKNAFINLFTPTPNVQTPASFSNALAGAYQLYNRAKRNYGPDVVARSASFLPASSRSIF